MERYFDACGISSQWEKRSQMLHLAGQEIQEIFDHLPGVNEIHHVLTDPPYFDVAIKRLDEHFEPMRRRNYERHLFRQIVQKTDERFADFVLRLRIQAKRCEFDRYDAREAEDRIVEQIVESCNSSELRRQILAKDMALEEIVSLGTTLADVQQQVKQMDRVPVESVPIQNMNKIFKRPRDTTSITRNARFDRGFGKTNQGTDRACFACGLRGHLKGDIICRARNAKCLKCGELGHFANRCFKRSNNSSYNKRIRMIEEEDEGEFTKNEIFYAMGKNLFEFIVGGTKIPMVIDSGADANVITEEAWKKVSSEGIKVTEFSREINRKLIAYATNKPMKLLGMFRSNIRAGSNEVEATFYIVEQGQQNLLGDQTAKQLKVLKIGFDIAFVKHSNSVSFPKIKGIIVEIPVNESVQPVQQGYRRAPLALEGKIHDKLKFLLEKDIIEKVHGPSAWVSPMIPILKSSGEVRICVDMRRANQAILRESHPLPLIEELLGSLGGAIKFSKLDIKEAYHQLELSEKSREITTFITKYGLFRYKRLMFGICCAPELFQKVMDTVVAGLEGVAVYLDDMLVFGNSQDEHNNRLKALMNRLKEYGVFLNLEKCLFNSDKLEFLGHELSSEGIKPIKSRVLALQQFREPLNAAELRSFLGLITYVGRFIPHLASKTEPLRILLKSGNKFEWTDKQQQAFNEIKQAVCNINHLGFFDAHHKTILIADASPSGLGAVLLQENRQGERRIIGYASKSLTDLERKYFQTEKEALALVWAVERFNLYLQGTRFKLITDCKPLQFLFSPRSKPCARLERWVLRLQSYSYDIVHEPGATNLADALSRLSKSDPQPFDCENENYLQFLTNGSSPSAIKIEEIRAKSKMDDVIREVFQALQEGIWTERAKLYKPYIMELCQSEDVLLRGERIVIPQSLQGQVLELAHEGHPGIVVMKRRLRQKVWWPLMDKEIECFVKRCKQCILVSSQSPPEPLMRTQMPEKPWTHIAVDFMGPLPSGHNLLVLVDYFSRFVEVVVMREITAKLTIQALHETFCRYGIPESMKTDNGPQFISEALIQFSREFGFDLIKTSPYWPQANGEVERANKALKKRLQISQETPHTDWKWDLRMYLLMYNSTPHSTTGVAPSALMFGRVLRDKLPTIPTFGKSSISFEEIRDRDRVKKFKEAEYYDQRHHAAPNPIKAGDIVVAKRMIRDNKLSCNFSPEELEVIQRTGSDVTLRSKESGRLFHRNVSHLKPLRPETHITEQCNNLSNQRILNAEL